MKYCGTCITPCNRPNIRFDANGRCNCATGADKRKALRDLDHWRERLRSEGAGTEANACEIRRLLSEETAGSRPGQ